MKIKKEIYQDILKVLPMTPPEVGGIIGGKEDIVSVFEIDFGKAENAMCSYTPDVEYINMIIKKWLKNDWDFYGIFHTHFFNVDTLSEGDVNYMKKIIEAMPDMIDKLYFPLFVLPKREMIVYLIEKRDEKVLRTSYELV